MRKYLILTIYFLLSISVSFANNFFIEANQMLNINWGYNYEINNSVGIRGALGLSPFGLKPLSASLSTYYRCPENFKNIDYFFEFGIPISYMDLWEDKYINWDSSIDGPYAGFLTGITVRTIFYRKVSLNVGVAYWTEWQDDSDTKNAILPIFTLSYEI